MEVGKAVDNKAGDVELPLGTFVEGMIYTLTAEDEARLDVSEGVPYAYIKEMLDIHLSPSSSLYTGGSSSIVKALVYINLNDTTSGESREEYVGRMNRGISDAREKGMSER